MNGDTQAAFTLVTESQAKVQSAKLEATANEERQKGYAACPACPACAAIDQMEAISSTITTYAPGAGFAVTGK